MCLLASFMAKVNSTARLPTEDRGGAAELISI